MVKPNKKSWTIRTFGIASFLNDFGSDMIFPFWPIFVTSVLGANMAVLGFLDGLGDALVSISQALSGYFSDKFGKRKWFIVFGYFFGALARLGYAMSRTWYHLIPFKMLDRVGKMRDSPRDALVAEVSKHETRGKSFGFLRMMDHLGALSGVITSMVLFSILGYRKLFMVAAIPTLISVALVTFFIKERKRKVVKSSFKLVWKKLGKNYNLFLVTSALFYIGAFSYSFLLVFANKFGVKTVYLPALYLLFTSVAAIVSYPAGRLDDVVGRKKMIFISYLLWIVTALFFVFSYNLVYLLLGFVFYGLHLGVLQPSQKTLISELSPKKFRASGIGLFRMIIGFSALPASVIAGFLWDKISFVAPFIFSIALTAVSLVLLFFVKETD